MTEQQQIETTFDQWALVETWRAVVGYEGVYEVSDKGRVRRVAGGRGIRIGRMLTPQARTDGYLHVQLWHKNLPCTRLIHRLVALSFLGAPPQGREINHIDGDKHNNVLSNLEYVTRSENNLHAYRTGLQPIGENRPGTKLKNAQVIEIRRLHSDEGLGCRRLARRFGCSKQTIDRVLSGKSWTHVKEVE